MFDVYELLLSTAPWACKQLDLVIGCHLFYISVTCTCYQAQTRPAIETECPKRIDKSCDLVNGGSCSFCQCLREFSWLSSGCSREVWNHWSYILRVRLIHSYTPPLNCLNLFESTLQLRLVNFFHPVCNENLGFSFFFFAQRNKKNK